MATTQEAARADVDGSREGNAAANRRNAAHAILVAASALVGLPAACGRVRALVLLLLLLLGCTTVHLAMGGRRRLLLRRAVRPAAAPRVDRSPARLRWTGFHALLLLGPTYWPAEEPRPQQQLVQVLVAYALFVVGAVLVLVSTTYDGVPHSRGGAGARRAPLRRPLRSGLRRRRLSCVHLSFSTILNLGN